MPTQTHLYKDVIKLKYDAFKNEVSLISLYHRDAKSLFKKEIIELGKWKDHKKKFPDSKKLGMSVNNFSFKDLTNGKTRFYSQIKRTAEDRIITAWLLRNKQYQWLLTDIYELYEDFLENCYAYIGWKNHDLWPMKDFGNTKLPELKGKPFDWFLEKSKKQEPTYIINAIRNNYPRITKIEGKNNTISIKLVMLFIEKMRHIIVHVGGKTTRKEEFIDAVLNANGTPLNNREDTINYCFLNQFFGEKDYKNTLILLEVPTDDIPGLDTHIDIFEMLVGNLIGYATLIYEEIQ